MNKEAYLQEKKAHSTYCNKPQLDYYRLNYHLMPPSGWLNDPNGLVEFQGRTHIYYQYSPFTTGWGMKLWGHYSTDDYVTFKSYDPFLYPDIEEDRSGVYSGCAIVHNSKIYYFYTGNVKLIDKDYNYDYEGRHQNTICVVSEDGVNYQSKIVVLTPKDYPDFVGVHVRDPKVFKQNDIFYMVLGARNKNDLGCALIYRSYDLLSWEYHFVIEDKAYGYMWECPDIVCIDNHYFLVFSPQGLQQKGFDYANVYQTGYCKLEIDFENKKYQLGKFYEMDRGFDFYATQTYRNSDNEVIAISWMGLPDTEYNNCLNEKFNWQHALTMPRVLSANGDRIIQKPIDAFQKLRKNDGVEILSDTFTVEDSYELEIDISNDFEINIEDAILKFKNNVLTLDVTRVGSGRTTRSVACDTVTKLQIFKDTSSIEIFVNEGEEVFTTRFFPNNKTLKIIAENKKVVYYSLDGYIVEE